MSCYQLITLVWMIAKKSVLKIETILFFEMIYFSFYRYGLSTGWVRYAGLD
jgi:hypothetical protein